MRPNDPYDFSEEEFADSLAREAEEEVNRDKSPITRRELADIWKEVFGDETT